MLDDLALSIRRPRFSRSRRGVAGLALVLGIVAAALLAPLLTPYDPLEQRLAARRQAPSIQHPCGLDELGRDNLSRVLYGGRLSMRVGLTTVVLAMIVGGLLGGLAGYRGGWLDSVLMSLMDLLLAFPTLLFAIALVMILGRGQMSATVAIALGSVPAFARLMRVGVLAAKGQSHVLAARSVGVPPGRLLFRHILPGVLPAVIVQAMLAIGTAILEFAGLSFLGLASQPPLPEWGAMIAQGRGAVFAAPHIVLFPGLAIMLTVLGFNLLGDGLRDVLDPRAVL